MKHLIRILVFAAMAPTVVFAATQSYATPGTYTFAVPSYGSLSVTVRGAGGGGESGSTMTTDCVSGGGGNIYRLDGNAGAAGSASAFGSTQAPGGAGGGGAGAITSGGAAGGAGGAAGGDDFIGFGFPGAKGLDGGFAQRSFAQDALSGTVTIVVGAGGAGGAGVRGFDCNYSDGREDWSGAGGAGGNGSVAITWTDPAPAPTCSVSFEQNPLTGQSTAMHWSSSNADVFHINNVGYVSANGQALAYNAGDYSGQVQGSGGTAACTAILKEGTQCTGSGCSGTRYSCSSNNQCIVDANGSYTTADCNHQCSSAPAHYACVQHQCVSSASGPYTASNCDDACAAQCPAGQVRSGNACACANGLNINQYPICTCPSGYAQHGAACVKQGCTDPDGYYCVSNAIVHRVNCKDATFKVCAALQSCTDGSTQCANPAIGVNVKFHAQPALVRPGQTSQLFWDVDQVSACDFSGNRESWTQADHAVNPAGGRTTAPITGQTIYTMTCHALWGVTPASLTQRATINVVPSFNEH